MNSVLVDVGGAGLGFLLPCLVAVCRTRHRAAPAPAQQPPCGVLVTRFRVCPSCARTQACSLHRDGSFTCLTCMTTQPARTTNR